MKEAWQKLLQRIDRLAPRERGLVLLSILAVVFLLWDFALYRWVAKANDAVEAELRATGQKIAALEQQQAILQTQDTDPDLDLKQRQQALAERLAELDANLAALSVGLVPVDQLAAILREVLAKTGALQLHSMQTLPVEPLQLTVKTGTNAVNAGVYKHTVALTVKGNYFQVMEYLKRLESMPWRFYWDELHYNQTRYPDGLFELRVYTLSTDEGLFGV